MIQYPSMQVAKNHAVTDWQYSRADHVVIYKIDHSTQYGYWLVADKANLDKYPGKRVSYLAPYSDEWEDE